MTHSINWNSSFEASPDDDNYGYEIDDYNRDLRVGIRKRMDKEHEFPSSQAATSEAGAHKFMTLQEQAIKPSLSGTQKAAVFADTANNLSFEKSDGSVIPIIVGTAVVGGAVTPTSGLSLALVGTQFPAGTGLLGLNFSVTAGTAAHGVTVGSISGFSSSECMTFVSVNTLGAYSGGDGDALQEFSCSINASRVITCSGKQRDAGNITGIANFIMMGVK